MPASFDPSAVVSGRRSGLGRCVDSNADFRIVHVLDGTTQRGYRVSEDIKSGAASRVHDFDTLAAAEAFFASLDGAE
jgi:hypothetical protein